MHLMQRSADMQPICFGIECFCLQALQILEIFTLFFHFSHFRKLRVRVTSTEWCVLFLFCLQCKKNSREITTSLSSHPNHAQSKILALIWVRFLQEQSSLISILVCDSFIQLRRKKVHRFIFIYALHVQNYNPPEIEKTGNVHVFISYLNVFCHPQFVKLLSVQCSFIPTFRIRKYLFNIKSIYNSFGFIIIIYDCNLFKKCLSHKLYVLLY